jgi:hypothetical protein
MEELRHHIRLVEVAAHPVARYTAEEVGLHIRPAGLEVGIVLAVVEGPTDIYVSH